MNQEELSKKILSDLTTFSKYAKYIPKIKRRETWDEICCRVEKMHIKKYPKLKNDIIRAFNYVKEKKVVPSMRSMQFAGKPIEINNSRIFNCAFTSIQGYKDFSEIMELLLGGSGVGYSVQSVHINKLPEIKKPKKPKKYLIGDSIEGWADAIRILMKAYLNGTYLPLFDYTDIRQKGSQLITAGGKAPGPEPLQRCLNKIKYQLDKKEIGSKLISIEVHDIICTIADCVLAGGVRRAALISFFDKNDKEMLMCKRNFDVEILNGGFHFNPVNKVYEGEVKYKNKAQFISLNQKQFEEFQIEKKLPWYYFEPQRARANNSVVLLRKETSEEEFSNIIKLVKESGSGEPGFFWTNDKNWMGNPCLEISLQSRQFCNLTSINFSNIKDEKDFEERIWSAVLIGTLQAGYTNFHYLSAKWQDNSEKESLLGVSLTGIGDNKNYKEYNWKKITDLVLKTNEEYAEKIGTNKASRICCIKPEGSSSTVLGTSSGIHARFAPYYIRRVRYNKNEPIAEFLINNHSEIVEDEFGNPNAIVVSIPQRSPETSIFRDESALETLERVKFFHENWIRPTHRNGTNSHNVSCTINIKNNEWEKVKKWMWDNRESYNGISIFPYDGGSYLQAPFEEITKEKYLEMINTIKDIDFTKIIEDEDLTTLKEQVACAGNVCELV
jgi:ribonucleoside-diphosphate reductase alpha chain